MAAYYFDRDTKVYAHVPLAADGDKNMHFELPVLDGFSFSQATNTTEITLNQAQTKAGVSLRARQMFNDSYAPAEWSFSTYMSPYISTGGAKGAAGKGATTSGFHCDVSEAMWGMFFSQTVNGAVTGDLDNCTIVTTASDKATLGVFDLYFVLGGASVAYATGAPASSYVQSDTIKVYKIADCSVNELSFDFDIDGIATVAWSGQGKVITEADSALDLVGSTTLITEGVRNTAGFIRNRVSDLTLTNAEGSPFAAEYATTLTGGNITMSNNLTYLTPETLGIVNQPLGHVTGTRNIGGNVTCYLDNASDGSAELFEDIIESRTDIKNVFSFAFDIGAGSGETLDTRPYLLLTMPKCHIEVPTITIDDVISLETNFHALPATLTSADEIDPMEFYGIAVANA